MKVLFRATLRLT
jgi:hypothetical protein